MALLAVFVGLFGLFGGFAGIDLEGVVFIFVLGPLLACGLALLFAERPVEPLS